MLLVTVLLLQQQQQQLILTDSRPSRCCGLPIWSIENHKFDAFFNVCDRKIHKDTYRYAREIQSDTVRYSQICTAFKIAYVHVFMIKIHTQ